jgi:hypothetical protein
MTEEIIEVPYGDLYLKFTDEAQSLEVLAGYEGSIDVIGVISSVDNTDPLADGVGQENPVSTALDGWHVNTRGPITLELEAFSVLPTNPRRVWA